ncbi:RING-H2 finger protein ATL64-like [Phoenix dactylifera]|uniref:RING-H2 finger protein ATL64-like n=1 Tax=Phoenix dactylifera TaxID=42345 RepID=A0A8B7BZW6_PHODC|nr:RING-H2 finger protein ATL64-like [Phoenix dactylifera]
MNSFHEHSRRYSPRTPLPLSPSDTDGHIQLEKTLSIVFVAVFFITFGYLILKPIYRCLDRCRRRRRDLQPTTNYHNETVDIVPARFSDAYLRGIPVRVFGSESSPSSDNSGGGGGGGSEEKESCSVCLAEYVEGEETRVLPRCKHMFHKACIDQWLLTRSHLCPICRARVIELDVRRDRIENYRNTSRDRVRLHLEALVNMGPLPRVAPVF